MSEHRKEDWINLEIILSNDSRSKKAEKDFILSVIKPFVEKYRRLIELFHFTRIYESPGGRRENYIRWRIKPKTGLFNVFKNFIFNRFKKSLVKKLNDCKQRNIIIGYREESFGKDPTHDRTGCNPDAYDVFMKYLDSISRITIELLERQPTDYPMQGVVAPDYYAHFLFNQFGSHSLYNSCQCSRGSWTIHPCFVCQKVPIPSGMRLQN